MRFISCIKYNFFILTTVTLTISHSTFAALLTKELLPRLGKNIFTRIADTAHLCAMQCELKQQENMAATHNKTLLEEKYAEELKQLYQENALKHGHRLSEQDRKLYFYSPVMEDELNSWNRLSSKQGNSFRITSPLAAALMGGFAGSCCISFAPAIAAMALVSGYAGYRREITCSEPVDLYRRLSAYRMLIIQMLETFNNRPSIPDLNAQENAYAYCEQYDKLESYHKEIGRVCSSCDYICDEYGKPVWTNLEEVHKEVHKTLQTMLLDPRMQEHPHLIDKWKYADNRLFFPINRWESERLPMVFSGGPYQQNIDLYNKALKSFEQKERKRIVEPDTSSFKAFTH